MKRTCLALALCSIAASDAAAQDLDVSRIGDNFNNYGVSGGVRAYSFSTTSCNVGSVPVLWNDSINEAPVIAQNMFRVADGRIEQLGYSFLKEGFCAVNENSCGTCQSTDCNTLGVGCADTYGAGLNDGRSGVTKSQINPTTGDKPNSLSGASTGHDTIRGRLQVLESELGTAGAQYFIESQYVSRDDQMAGNGRNNVSWRRINVNPSTFGLSVAGTTMRDDPAIYAWAAADTGVTVNEIVNVDEGGAGVHGYYFVGFKATDLGGGFFRYEYAVQNTTSDASCNGFRVPLPCAGVTITQPFFRDVDAHSGDPYDPTDWTFSASSTEVSWTGADFATHPNGNALRWGTLYSFGFTADAAPIQADVELGLFKTTGTLTTQALVPGASMQVYCTANTNSLGVAAEINPSGSVQISANDIEFLVEHLPSYSMGYFLMSEGQQFVPDFGNSQGNLCIGDLTSRIYRFSLDVIDAGIFGTFVWGPDLANLPENVVLQPGETWNFQYWYRDTVNQTATSNTTPAVTITFCQ